MVRRGEEVRIKTTIENTGDETHTFQIGFTMRHVDTGQDFNLPLQSERESPGGRGDETAVWIIPENAPLGNYAIISAVWEGEENGVPFNRLDDRTVPNAFIVE